MLSIIPGSTAPAQIQTPPPVSQAAPSAVASAGSRTSPDTVTISDAGRQAQVSHASSDGDSDAS